MRFARLVISIFVGAVLARPADAPASLRPEQQALLQQIRAASLRGNLSFLSSDLLEGRGTPSRGLDLAAEFIASQFRRAGLQPAGDDGFFQTATMSMVEPTLTGAELTLQAGETKLRVDPGQLSVLTAGGVQLQSAALVKVDLSASEGWAALATADVAGKVLLVQGGGGRGASARAARAALRQQIERWHPTLVVTVEENKPETRRRGSQLEDPTAQKPEVPAVLAASADLSRWLADVPPGIIANATISGQIPAPVQKGIKLHNVIGVLPGSDPVLKDTYVLITAHYDHLGLASEGKGDDRVYNGANDDGSGTVSVIELASAFAAAPQPPKRSLVFIAYFGEELGLVGSRYYGRHPIFPLKKTIADLNLEQLGRTDATTGPRPRTLSITGVDYTDIGPILTTAAHQLGIVIKQTTEESDAFFSRSDNQALADQGIPAHTLCTAFEYPDYHGLADTWDKIDYDNMALIDRAVALAVQTIADAPSAPSWNAQSPKTEKYRQAADALR